MAETKKADLWPAAYRQFTLDEKPYDVVLAMIDQEGKEPFELFKQYREHRLAGNPKTDGLYVVLHYPTDPFEEGLPRYMFEASNIEGIECSPDEDSHLIVLNASAWQKAEEPGLKSYLRYIATGEATSEFTAKIDKAVVEANEVLQQLASGEKISIRVRPAGK